MVYQNPSRSLVVLAVALKACSGPIGVAPIRPSHLQVPTRNLSASSSGAGLGATGAGGGGSVRTGSAPPGPPGFAPPGRAPPVGRLRGLVRRLLGRSVRRLRLRAPVPPERDR